jgi:multiple sugar transport system ATP-binding protein
MAPVTIANARKSYGTHPIIKGISVNVEDGEFVALVGPSGCGKSTLLRMIAGLEEITEGTISIGNVVVNDLSPKERDVAMVFQNYALYPHMTVAQNMGFSLKIARSSPTEIETRVKRAAAILDLEGLLARYPRELSGGQRQRVAMGRAIVRNPKVFLFDEPLSNLDAQLRVQMRGEIKQLHHTVGTTTIYVTHDQIEAMTMADRIVVLRGGVVEQAGAPLEVYDSPTNLFVASFIGSPSINQLKGTVRRVDGKPRFVVAETTLPLPENTPSRVEDTPVVYGIRPEHLSLGEGGVPARVEIVEPTGSETQIVATLGGQKIVCVFRDRLSTAPGSLLSLKPDLQKVLLFDAGTGNRIQTN